jgi:hypothetical protein
MAGPAVEAALASALANQQFSSVAAILDAAELEVCGCCCCTLLHHPHVPTHAGPAAA